MIRKKLSEEDFQATVARMNLSEKTRAIARRVLVHGEKQKIVAAESNLTAPTVSDHVKRVWQQYTDDAQLPPGTCRITAVLSSERAAIVKQWEQEERIRRINLD